MSKPIVIRLDQVTKTYRGVSMSSGGFKDLLLHLPTHLRNRSRAFNALSGVSFEVCRGEFVGIIGRNGSGKSTTLGLIAGVLRPTTGRVETRGHICPLLELGAGFHPDLSGAENIYLNGILLGMTREQVRKKFDGIVEFSELADFLYQPIRTYSSGMIARLGFSVAVHLEPDILLVDELLAVGDGPFQQKCFAKIDEFQARGVTVVLVTHDPGTVAQRCQRAVLLHHGRLLAWGPAKEVVELYCNPATLAVNCSPADSSGR